MIERATSSLPSVARNGVLYWLQCVGTRVLTFVFWYRGSRKLRWSCGALATEGHERHPKDPRCTPGVYADHSVTPFPCDSGRIPRPHPPSTPSPSLHALTLRPRPHPPSTSDPDSVGLPDPTFPNVDVDRGSFPSYFQSKTLTVVPLLPDSYLTSSPFILVSTKPPI